MTTPDSGVNDYLFAHSTNGILVIDPQGLIERVNPAAEVMLNLPASQLIGKTPGSVFADEALRRLCADQHTAELALPNGRFANATAAALGDRRRVVLLDDITPQRTFDLRRDELLLRIAHDLRNPVASLVGYADLIETFGDLNADQLRFLNRTRDTGIKFYELIGDLVDLAWMEADMPRRTVPVDIGACIGEAITRLEATAKDKQIEISTELEPSLPPVQGEANRLRELVEKLLHNAILYSPDGSMVTVHAWQAEQSVFCSVSDHGIGISPENLDLVYDRLYRAPDARVQAIPGGGLGLTTARRIAQYHGGALWAESIPDSGSTFTFRLPAAPE